MKRSTHRVAARHRDSIKAREKHHFLPFLLFSRFNWKMIFCNFSSLPAEVHRHIVEFLTAEDCINVSRAGAALQSIYRHASHRIVEVVSDDHPRNTAHDTSREDLTLAPRTNSAYGRTSAPRRVPFHVVKAPNKYSWFSNNAVNYIFFHQKDRPLLEDLCAHKAEYPTLQSISSIPSNPKDPASSDIDGITDIEYVKHPAMKLDLYFQCLPNILFSVQYIRSIVIETNGYENDNLHNGQGFYRGHHFPVLPQSLEDFRLASTAPHQFFSEVLHQLPNLPLLRVFSATLASAEDIDPNMMLLMNMSLQLSKIPKVELSLRRPLRPISSRLPPSPLTRPIYIPCVTHFASYKQVYGSIYRFPNASHLRLSGELSSWYVDSMERITKLSLWQPSLASLRSFSVSLSATRFSSLKHFAISCLPYLADNYRESFARELTAQFADAENLKTLSIEDVWLQWKYPEPSYLRTSELVEELARITVLQDKTTALDRSSNIPETLERIFYIFTNFVNKPNSLQNIYLDISHSLSLFWLHRLVRSSGGLSQLLVSVRHVDHYPLNKSHQHEDAFPASPYRHIMGVSTAGGFTPDAWHEHQVNFLYDLGAKRRFSEQLLNDKSLNGDHRVVPFNDNSFHQDDFDGWI